MRGVLQRLHDVSAEERFHSEEAGYPHAVGCPDKAMGSMGTDFIVGLPESKNGYDGITT